VRETVSGKKEVSSHGVYSGERREGGGRRDALLLFLFLFLLPLLLLS
jgi:hypothetical protein